MLPVIDFYATVVSCANTVCECPNTVNDPARGWVPRGFYFEGRPWDVDLLIVGKNPGHPIAVEKTGLYSDLSPAALATTAFALAGQFFCGNPPVAKGEQRNEVFHRNLTEYICKFLDIQPSEIFQRCAVTNLVKCSTVGEQDRFRAKTKKECFAKHFVREVQFLEPRVILALGREVEKFLCQRRIKKQHGRPVVYVKHPSYYYSTLSKEAILIPIKDTIQKHLRSANAARVREH
ncbi:MAG TPA: uracil-DNA glycosylase family protein [Thermoanaerobaculia bacterium]